MSTVIDNLLHDVEAAGIQIEIDPPDLIVTPVDRLSPDLEERIRHFKVAIIARLESELEASRKRLETQDVNIAILDTGEMRVVITEAETAAAIAAGRAIYSAADAYCFVQLTERERRMFHDFKIRSGGTIE
jgi:hypothetical protein